MAVQKRKSIGIKPMNVPGNSPNKSSFFKRVFTATALAAGLGLGAVGVREALQARNAKMEKQTTSRIVERDAERVAQNYGLTNKTARSIFNIYSSKLNQKNPNYNLKLRTVGMAISAAEAASNKRAVGISPARVLLTIESNLGKIETEHVFNKERGTHVPVIVFSEVSIKRNPHLAPVFNWFNAQNATTKRALIETAKIKGTHEKLKREVELERRETRNKQ